MHGQSSETKVAAYPIALRMGEDHIMHDISSLLCKVITDDLESLYIDGLFIIQPDAVSKIASNKVECIYMHKYTDPNYEAETVKITMEPLKSNRSGSFFMFPANDQKSAFATAKAMLSAPHIDFELSINSPKRTMLTLMKIPRDQVMHKSGKAHLYTHDKSAPVSRTAVFAIAPVSKITQISISGAHALTNDDMKLLVEQFGFHELHIGSQGIRLEGVQGILDYLAFNPDLPQSMLMMRDKNW